MNAKHTDPTTNKKIVQILAAAQKQQMVSVTATNTVERLKFSN